MATSKTPEQIERRRERRKARRLAKKLSRPVSENACNLCGRTLTDPESIQRGFGPSCWKKATADKEHFEGCFPEAEAALRNADEDAATCLCGCDLRGQPVEGYEHDSGWKTDHGIQWLFVTCPNCKYEMALWKMGIRRGQDFSSQPEPEAPVEEEEKKEEVLDLSHSLR